MIYSLSFKHTLPKDAIIIDITSNSKTDGKWLSPFFLGPTKLYDGYIAKNIENAYQFSKIYSEYVDIDNNPTSSYWDWAQQGWTNPKPIKYPLGAWVKHLYHYWNGCKLSDLEARKEIFVPLYTNAVKHTKAFEKLKNLYQRTKKDIILLDYEGYDHRLLNLTLIDVLNHKDYHIGQGFVLCMMLEGILK